jgi:calcium binding protein 39
MNEYLHLRNFDVSSDATATFKSMVDSDAFAEYLKDEANYNRFFELYHAKLVLAIKEYVTMREALKLLGEILLKRSNFDIMMRYISSKANLKVVMTAMASKSDQIKFEAFHVFKVFVANPQKSPGVHALLYANRNMLVKYLQTYHKDKADDAQFTEERTLLISTLSALEPLPKGGGATPPAAP